MNINLAIIQGAKILKDSFIKNPYLDSEILMTKTIQKDRKYILLNPNKNLDIENLNTFQNLINKRSIGVIELPKSFIENELACLRIIKKKKLSNSLFLFIETQ